MKCRLEYEVRHAGIGLLFLFIWHLASVCFLAWAYNYREVRAMIECCYCNLTSYLPGPEVDEDGDRTIGGMEGPGEEVGMMEIVVLGPVAIVIY